MWNNFLVGGIFGYLLRFIENKYPEQANGVKQKVHDFGIRIAYNSLYIYSGTQIWFTRIKNNYNVMVLPLIKDFLKKNFNYEFGTTQESTDNNNSYYIEFIENGNQISRHNFSFTLDNQGVILSTISEAEPKDYDFFILNDNINGKNNRVLYYKIPINLFYKEQPISQKFLSFNLEYNGETTEVQLSNDKYNFAIVGNFINRELVMYFLKNILHTPIPDNLHSSNLVYNIHIIDSNVNVINLDQTDELKITEDGYTISKLGSL
jgi:hypothetical protein